MAARILDGLLRLAAHTADGLPGHLGLRLRRVRLTYLRDARAV